MMGGGAPPPAKPETVENKNDVAGANSGPAIGMGMMGGMMP